MRLSLKDLVGWVVALGFLGLMFYILIKFW